MRNMLLWPLLAATLLLCGCGPMVSVRPLYTDRNLVQDLPLEGKWTDADSEDVLTVEKESDRYKLLILSDGAVQRFDMHLVALGPDRFLDVTPKDGPALAIGGHAFAKVWMENQEVCMALLAEDWLRQQPDFPSYVLADDDRQVLLTAPSEQLQRWLGRYAKEPRAFDTAHCLHRLR
jgi:hypothetical protein